GIRDDLVTGVQTCALPISSSFWNLRRLSDARLHAESSRYMYSLHGFEALIRPDAFDVCQSFTVVSNCNPGSPHCHAASATCRHRSEERRVGKEWWTRSREY